MKHKSFLNLRITWVIALILFFVHIYSSWALPSEGRHAGLAIAIFFFSPAVIVLLSLAGVFFKKLRSTFIMSLICLLIGSWGVVAPHILLSKPLWKTWPLTEVLAEVEKRCPIDGKCSGKDHKFDYTFPFILRKIEVAIYHSDEGRYIDIDYGQGRYASFTPDFELVWVD